MWDDPGYENKFTSQWCNLATFNFVTEPWLLPRSVLLKMQCSAEKHLKIGIRYTYFSHFPQGKKKQVVYKHCLQAQILNQGNYRHKRW